MERAAVELQGLYPVDQSARDRTFVRRVGRAVLALRRALRRWRARRRRYQILPGVSRPFPLPWALLSRGRDRQQKGWPSCRFPVSAICRVRCIVAEQLDEPLELYFALSARLEAPTPPSLRSGSRCRPTSLGARSGSVRAEAQRRRRVAKRRILAAIFRRPHNSAGDTSSRRRCRGLPGW